MAVRAEAGAQAELELEPGVRGEPCVVHLVALLTRARSGSATYRERLDRESPGWGDEAERDRP
jgi:hypothetical protein